MFDVLHMKRMGVFVYTKTVSWLSLSVNGNQSFQGYKLYHSKLMHSLDLVINNIIFSNPRKRDCLSRNNVF